MPAWCPLVAVVREMHALGELVLLAFAGEQCAAVLVTAEAEVFARDAHA